LRRVWRHSRKRDRDAIQYHYDVSNDFYSLWLDRNMVYSCAYFRGESDSLELAQEQKLDHILNKLLVQPGERFLESAALGRADFCARPGNTARGDRRQRSAGTSTNSLAADPGGGLEGRCECACRTTAIFRARVFDNRSRASACRHGRRHLKA